MSAAIAEALFLEKWYGISVDDASLIIEAAKQLDDEELLLRPVLVTGAMIASHLIAYDQAEDHTGALTRFSNLMLHSPERDFSGSLSGRGLGQWRQMEMIARRWRHEYDEALELSDLLESTPHGVAVKDLLFAPRGDGQWPGHLTLQRGISEALGGRTSSAMRKFVTAFDEGGVPPYGHYAKVNAAANAAMIAAVEGHIESAELWVARSRLQPPVPAWIQHLTLLGCDIAEAQIAIDAMQLEEAGMILARIESSGTGFELWPFHLHVVVEHDLAQGNAVGAYERLKEVGFTRDRLPALDSVAGFIIFRSYLDVLLDMGEGGTALRFANDLGHPLRSLVPVARIHLLGGDYDAAARTASQALRRADLPTRDMWESMWVHSLAETAQGNVDAALRSFAIVQQGKPRMLPAMLHRSPRALVEQLYEMAGETLAADSFTRNSVKIETPKLTGREEAILQQLAENLSPKSIAALDVLSEHTIRTHIKNLYRKLGATSRRDAIVRAEQFGLLRRSHLDRKNHVL